MFRRLFQENLLAFLNKTQVCKQKRQSCTEPSRVGHVMYCANNIQLNYLIANVLKVMEKEYGSNIEMAIHQESAFQTDSKRKLFNKNHNISDETERIYLNHQQLSTTHPPPPPKFCNLLAIHLLIALSSDPDSKYLMSGFQQRFVHYLGAFLSHKPH